MPLAGEYERQLHSEVADANNAPGNPGAITAALFLKHFTRGTAVGAPRHRRPGPRRQGRRRAHPGATGFGARLLADWVESLA